jgi:NAD(P)H-dependent FMN reductase
MTTAQPTPLQILIVIGSARAGSFNAKLAHAAAAVVRSAGHQATVFDSQVLRLPVYDAGIEATSGVPDGAQQLLDAVIASDGVLVVSPEYNGFPPPLLVNALDWLSRIAAQGARVAGIAATTSKPTALLSASPGPLGGLRAMTTLRQFLQMGFQMLVVPQQFALGKAQDAFDAQGALADAKAAGAVAGVVQALLALASSQRKAG